MSMYITAGGQAALNNGPVFNLTFALGDAVGYTPDASDTGPRGNIVLDGDVAGPFEAGPTRWRYTINLTDATDIEFGEIALLFGNGSLFSLTAYSVLQRKTANVNDEDGVGGAIDIFITASGEAQVDLNSGALFGELGHVDNVPTTGDSRYKMYAAPYPPKPELPMMLFRSDYLWGMTNYGCVGTAIIDSATLNTITVEGSLNIQENDIVQFGSGSFQSYVRVVHDSAVGVSTTTIEFAHSLTSAPAADTVVYLFKPTYLAVSENPTNLENFAFLPLDGDEAMKGVLKMGNNRITGLGNPQFGTDGANKTYADSVRQKRKFVNAAATGNVILNASNYDLFELTLVGNVSIAFSGGNDDQSLTVKVKQDAIGGRVMSLPATVRYNEVLTEYSGTTSPNAIDKLGFRFDKTDSRYDFVAVAKNIS